MTQSSLLWYDPVSAQVRALEEDEPCAAYTHLEGNRFERRRAEPPELHVEQVIWEGGRFRAELTGR